MPEKVTSLDVARKAGVSQSAVSRVFTPGASASKTTIDKVLKAAQELGYRPNTLARAMVTGKSRIIGLVVAYLDNQFYPDALERLSRALQDNGYHVLVFMAENSTEGVNTVMEEMLAYQVDGIVTASVSISGDLANLCEAAGIPVVLFNRGQDDARLTEVTSDNVAGGRSVANFLLGSGHERIAHIAGWQGASTGRDRAKGFLDGLADHGVAPVLVEDGLYKQDVAADLTRRIFGTSNRPDSVFVGNDHMAFAVMDTLRFEMGLRVPEDVSVVGYDDVPIASWPTYALTTVRQPLGRMVDATVSTLLSRIEGDDDTVARRVLIPGPLIIRTSARKPEGIAP